MSLDLWEKYFSMPHSENSSKHKIEDFKPKFMIFTVYLLIIEAGLNETNFVPLFLPIVQ